MDKNWRIIDIINWGVQYFNDKKIDEARLNIELMLSNVLKCSRLSLYLDFEKPLTEEELSILKQFVIRRANHEPLQYILNEAYFLNYKLYVNNDVLIPRPETEILVELIKKDTNKNDSLNILDIGTGSGCISIALGDYFPNSNIDSIDISMAAIKVAIENTESHNVNNISYINIDIFQDLPKNCYDIIVSNPPYISSTDFANCQPEVRNYEPSFALCDNTDGLRFYKRYAQIFGDLLSNNGKFYLEMALNQSHEITRLFSDNFKVDVFKDLNGIDRFAKGVRFK